MSAMSKTLLVAVGLVSAISCLASAEFMPDITTGTEVSFGYTAIDLPTALEWDEDYFMDWDQFYVRAELHAFFYQAGPVLLGATAAWNRLYYYWVRVPYVPTPLTYERVVQVVSIGVVGQFEFVDRLLLRVPVSLAIFGDGVTVGIRPTFLYQFPLSAKLDLSAGLTIDMILGSGLPIAAGATVGLDYALPLKR